jgi:hypothetical protein
MTNFRRSFSTALAYHAHGVYSYYKTLRHSVALGCADLAKSSMSAISIVMPLIVRQITVALLGLILALGTVAHGVQAATMNAKMMGADTAAVAMSSDMSGLDGCNGCGNPADKMGAAACTAMCAAPVAIVEAPFQSVEPASLDIDPFSIPLRLGLTFPPDLSPPRSAGLS